MPSLTTTGTTLLLLCMLLLLAAAPANSNPLNPSKNPRQAAPVQCLGCDPSAGDNKCHVSSSCVAVQPPILPPGKKNNNNKNAAIDDDAEDPYYCACPAGVKAGMRQVGVDPTAQWRLSWVGQEGRVFVRPGVKCDAVCKEPGCGEVWVYDQCM